MKRYIYTEVDNLSDRGCNKAVEVYLLRPNGFPTYIGGNYSLNSASWAGYMVEARKIVREKCGHRFVTDAYSGFISKNIKLGDIRGV